ncbi:MAG: exo-alpha-sialidase [Fimbriimonadaceae bacterium]|nr:exo-alpha-sialidase [Fimbriimonadaceae bacterium]
MVLHPHPVVLREFVFDRAPFAQCHAATVEETANGLVAAWFAGTREGHPDVGIWVSRRGADGWSYPTQVAKDERYPCWNPVLCLARPDRLLLFYKVGPSPVDWWGMLATSPDGGRTWSPSRRLPEGILGPIKNRPLRLPNGDLLCPSSTEHGGWRVHFERSPDLGRTWAKTPDLGDGKTVQPIQPSLLTLGPDRLRAIGRTQQDRLFVADSTDAGRTWVDLRLTDVPNPNSGTDALTLKDGRHLLVFNPTRRSPGHWGGPRTPLCVALSSDGIAWKEVLTLEDEANAEFSYPSVIQARDGKVHIVYTWKRERVRHVVLDPTRLGGKT